MRTGYIIAIIVALGLAVILAFLPEKDNSRVELEPEQIFYELNQNTRFYSTDKIADLLINEDPSITLIDVRGEEDYDEFHLPGALCVPLDSFLNDEWDEFFRYATGRKVFYSNGTIQADQAWMLGRRLGYENIFVMKGGLNMWVETILRPELPPLTETDNEVLDRYMFRKAASQYFGQGNTKVEETDIPEPKPVIRKRKVETTVAGGC